MGPKFKLIFVWPNLATQPKEHRVWTRRRNKVIAFPQWKHIFPCLKSLATFFSGVCVRGPFIIRCFFPRRGPERIWHLLCVFSCLSALVSRRRPRAATFTRSTSSCTCVRAGVMAGEAGACIHAFVCCCLWPALFSVLLSRGHGPVQALRSFPVTG